MNRDRLVKRLEKINTNKDLLARLGRWMQQNERNGSWVAREIGYSPAAVWQWLNGGREPSDDAVARIAELIK